MIPLPHWKVDIEKWKKFNLSNLRDQQVIFIFYSAGWGGVVDILLMSLAIQNRRVKTFTIEQQIPDMTWSTWNLDGFMTGFWNFIAYDIISIQLGRKCHLQIFIRPLFDHCSGTYATKNPGCQLHGEDIFLRIHPQSLTWNLKMMLSKRNLLFQGLIFRFHVKLQGCNVSSKSGQLTHALTKNFTKTRRWHCGLNTFFRYLMDSSTAS